MLGSIPWITYRTLFAHAPSIVGFLSPICCEVRYEVGSIVCCARGSFCCSRLGGARRRSASTGAGTGWESCSGSRSRAGSSSQSRQSSAGSGGQGSASSGCRSGTGTIAHSEGRAADGPGRYGLSKFLVSAGHGSTELLDVQSCEQQSPSGIYRRGAESSRPLLVRLPT